jgi:hypothetical protein
LRHRQSAAGSARRRRASRIGTARRHRGARVRDGGFGASENSPGERLDRLGGNVQHARRRGHGGAEGAGLCDRRLSNVPPVAACEPFDGACVAQLADGGSDSVSARPAGVKAAPRRPRAECRSVLKPGLIAYS